MPYLSPGKFGRLEPAAHRALAHARRREVDLVIERDDGSVVALEIKAGSRVADRDMAGLRVIRDALGDAFVAGAVMHSGEWSYASKDGFFALPVDRLWTPA